MLLKKCEIMCCGRKEIERNKTLQSTYTLGFCMLLLDFGRKLMLFYALKRCKKYFLSYFESNNISACLLIENKYL